MRATKLLALTGAFLTGAPVFAAIDVSAAASAIEAAKLDVVALGVAMLAIPLALAVFFVVRDIFRRWGE